MAKGKAMLSKLWDLLHVPQFKSRLREWWLAHVTKEAELQAARQAWEDAQSCTEEHHTSIGARMEKVVERATYKATHPEEENGHA